MQTSLPPMTLRSAITNLTMSEGANWPEYLRTNMVQAQSSVSPMPVFVYTMEALYAAKGIISPEALTVCGQCADIVNANDLFGKTDRAFAIFRVMRRLLGETQGPNPSTDPEPEDQYLEPEEPEVEP